MAPMMMLIAAVPVLVALWLAAAPVSSGRIARFERRHGVTLAAGEHELVAGHLAHTRRWRAFGAAAGGAAGIVSASSGQSITLPVTAMAAGWLAGAVVAELRSGEPGGAVLPVLLRRVPAVLAAVAAGVTVLMLVLGRPAHRPEAVLAWGLGALACAGAIRAVHRHIAGRPGPVTPVRAAMAADSASAVAGVGVALALACLAGQPAVIREGYFDTTEAAVGLLAVGWALGGIAVGWWVAHTSVRPLIGTVAALVLLSAGAVGVARARDQPPYPVSALQPTVTLRLTDETHFDADARAVGVTGLRALVGVPGQQFVGRLEHRPPAGAHGTYHVAVIDRRRNRMADWLVNTEGGGWNGFMSLLARRYPWLSAMEAPRTPDGSYGTPGMTVSKAAGEPGPFVFAGNFPEAGGLTAGDLMVVLIFTGPENQTYWAEPVPTST